MVQQIVTDIVEGTEVGNQFSLNILSKYSQLEGGEQSQIGLFEHLINAGQSQESEYEAMEDELPKVTQKLKL